MNLHAPEGQLQGHILLTMAPVRALQNKNDNVFK